MSLMDLLLQGPSASDRFQQISPLLGSDAPLHGGPQYAAPGGGGGPAGNVEGTARDFFLQHGYSRPDWRKVDSIIERESGWDPRAVNDSSGAAGIAQNINGFSQGYSRGDPMEQIRWLFNYLNGHNYEGYGTGIDAAYAHKEDTGWY